MPGRRISDSTFARTVNGVLPADAAHFDDVVLYKGFLDFANEAVCVQYFTTALAVIVLRQREPPGRRRR